MTASTPNDGQTDSYDAINRQAGRCPVCGEPYAITRTVPGPDGRDGAFYAHDTGEPLVELCIEWPDGSTERRAGGLRDDWFGQPRG